jgi:hypothetical protein
MYGRSIRHGGRSAQLCPVPLGLEQHGGRKRRIGYSVTHECAALVEPGDDTPRVAQLLYAIR